jgi:hypothetical protein
MFRVLIALAVVMSSPTLAKDIDLGLGLGTLPEEGAANVVALSVMHSKFCAPRSAAVEAYDQGLADLIPPEALMKATARYTALMQTMGKTKFCAGLDDLAR